MTLQEWKDKIKARQGFSNDEKGALNRLNRKVQEGVSENLQKAGRPEVAQEFSSFMRNIQYLSEPENVDTLTEEQFNQIMTATNNLDAYLKYNYNFATIVDAFEHEGEDFLEVIGILQDKLGINIDKKEWENNYKIYQEVRDVQYDAGRFQELAGRAAEMIEDKELAAQIKNIGDTAVKVLADGAVMTEQDKAVLEGFPALVADKNKLNVLLDGAEKYSYAFGGDGEKLVGFANLIDKKFDIKTDTEKLSADGKEWGENNRKKWAENRAIDNFAGILKKIKEKEGFQSTPNFDEAQRAIEMAGKAAMSGKELTEEEKAAVNAFAEKLMDPNNNMFDNLFDASDDYDKENPAFGKEGEKFLAFAEALKNKFNINAINMDVLKNDVADAIKPEEPKVDAVKLEEPKTEEVKPEEPKVDAVKNEEPKVEPIKQEQPKVEQPVVNNAQPQNQPKYAWDDEHYSMHYLIDLPFNTAKTALPPKNKGGQRGYFKTKLIDDDGYPINSVDIDDEAEQERLRELINANPEMKQRYDKNQEDLSAIEKDIRKKPFKKEGVDPRQTKITELKEAIEADESEANRQLDEELSNYAKQYAYRNTKIGMFISPASQHVHTSINSYIRSDVGVQKAKQLSEDFSKALIKEAKKQDDKTYKQFLENKAFKIDYRNGNYMKSMFTNPYVNTLMAMDASEPGIKYDIKEQRKFMGNRFTNNCYAMRHYATNELRVDYYKQRQEKKGWTPESEKKYRELLNQAHTGMLKGYDTFKKYNDVGFDDRANAQNDPAVIKLKECLGNMPSHDLGKSPTAQRSIVSAIGYIRGEKIALDNGWGVKELGILGEIGAIDEEMKRIEKYGTPEMKQGMDIFKNKFVKLKTEVYCKYPVTSTEKKDIADKINQFIESQLDSSPFAKRVLGGTKARRELFNKQYNLIKEDAEKNREHDAEIARRRLEDPIGYSRELQQEAIQTGDMTKFVNELAVIESEMSKMNGKPSIYSKKQIRDWCKYKSEIEDTNNKDFFDKYTRAVSDLRINTHCNVAELREQIQHDIKNGIEDVSPEYNDIKDDLQVSANLTNDMYDESYLLMFMVGVDTMQFGLGMSKNSDRFQEFQKDVATKLGDYSKYGLSKAEVNRRVAMATDAPSKPEKYLKKENGLDEEYASKLYACKLLESYKDSEHRITKFANKFEQIRNEANKKLERLNALAGYKAENSIEFVRMQHDLKTLAALDSKCTPAQFQEALEDVQSSSFEYEEKINKQGGGFFKNGSKRKALSAELQTFADTSLKELISTSTGRINYIEPIDTQLQLARQKKADMIPLATLNINALDNKLKTAQAVNYDVKNPENNDPEAIKNAAAEIIVIHSIKSRLNPKPLNANSEKDKPLAPDEITHEYYESSIEKMMKNPVFKRMIKDTPIDKLASAVKSGTGTLLIDKMSMAKSNIETEKQQAANMANNELNANKTNQKQQSKSAGKA